MDKIVHDKWQIICDEAKFCPANFKANKSKPPWFDIVKYKESCQFILQNYFV